MAVELKVPQSGESISEVQVGAWRKKEGELVARDEVVVELETDKASMELVAPSAGRLTRVLKQTGESAAIGDVLCVIDAADAPAAPASKPAAPARGAPSPAAARPAPPPAETPKPAPRPAPAAEPPSAPRAAPAARPDDGERGEPRIMPAARRAMHEQNIPIEQVRASGPGGRVLKEDVLAAIEEKNIAQWGRRPDSVPPVPASLVAADLRRDEARPMTPMRKKIAERLVAAQHNAALLTTFNEIDMTEVMALRNAHKDAFEKRYGVRLGFMGFFVKAAIEGLKLIPQINAEIRGADIIYHHYYDVGVAVSTEKGLVVPVLRNAERMSFAEIEIAIGDFAKRARDNKISLDELRGGTFTISNGGVFGSLLSTPIINPPQSGILGLHAIQDRPVARNGQVVIRPMMYIALTYDHRMVDGREAVTFLKHVKDVVESPARMLMEV